MADTLIAPQMRSFMYGQFANLFKFAFWWVALSPLLYAICNGSTAIGVGRIIYNTALCVASPFGPLLIEHYAPRNILLSAATARFVVWCVLLPLAWVFFDTDVVGVESQLGVWVIVATMLLVDGAAVGLSSVLDIDFMGVDITAGYLGLEVTEEHRNQFNSRNELFFSACFVVFAPGMAFLGLGLKRAFEHWRTSGEVKMSLDQIESGTLAGIFVVTFAVATFFQFWFLWGLKRPGEGEGDDDEAAGGAGSHSPHGTDSQSMGGRPGGASEAEQTLLPATGDAGDAGAAAATEEGPPPSTCQVVGNVLGDLKESFLLVISHRAILFRLIFFGFELSFEDAAIVVLAAQVGIRVPWMGDGGAVRGSIWTAVIVAVGKLGAGLASYVMMAHYQPPENIMGHTKLFICIGLSTLVVIAVPLAVDGFNSGGLSADAARAVVCIAFFAYFFLSTLPKLGLMSLLQTMVCQVENGHRAFAFIAVLATTIDSVVIMALSLLFTSTDKMGDADFSHALWVTCYVFLGHGLLETLFGPMLVLAPAAQDAARAAVEHAKADEAAAAAAASQQQDGDTRLDRVPSSLKPGPPSPRGGDSPSQDHSINAAEPQQFGTYSARSVAVPVPIATPRGGGAGGGGGGGYGTLGAGGVSPRLGGTTPRGLGGMTPRMHSNLGGAGDGVGVGSVMRQNMLGRGMGGSTVAASVLLPMRPSGSTLGGGGGGEGGDRPSGSTLAGSDAAGAGSYVRRSASRLHPDSTDAPNSARRESNRNLGADE